MDVLRSPELSLTFTEVADYDLVLFGALDHARRLIGRRSQKRIDTIAERMMADWCSFNNVLERMSELAPSFVEHSLVGEEAHLIVGAIYSYTEYLLGNKQTTKLDNRMAAHGLDVLDQVRFDIAS